MCIFMLFSDEILPLLVINPLGTGLFTPLRVLAGGPGGPQEKNRRKMLQLIFF